MPTRVWDFLSNEGFQPHGMCLLWRPDVFWAHAISDLIIALSYFSIPGALVFLAIRRSDLVYRWVLYLFGAFIVACGLTHLVGIWTLWVPDYSLQAIIKALTALISLCTAAALWPLMPKLLATPSNRQLEEKNLALAREVAEREAAEAKLKALNEQLERRVYERTQSLLNSNTALSESRLEAECANKAKDEFLAKMSHELRTPLNAIIGFSEIIKDKRLGPVGTERYRDYAKDIFDSGRHLLDLINDILDLSKVQSGVERLHCRDIDVARLLKSIITLVGASAESNGVTLELNVPRHMPRLSADQRKLKQILINLLSNAVKFTPAGGKVIVKASPRPDGSYEFKIIDTGVGMAPGDIPNALIPFQQIDNACLRGQKGTGLGLPLTKSLIDLHCGHMDLQSSPGEGTIVTVWLPSRQAANPLPIAPEYAAR